MISKKEGCLDNQKVKINLSHQMLVLLSFRLRKKFMVFYMLISLLIRSSIKLIRLKIKICKLMYMLQDRQLKDLPLWIIILILLIEFNLRKLLSQSDKRIRAYNNLDVEIQGKL